MLENNSFFVLLTKFLAIVFLGIGSVPKPCKAKEIAFITHKLIILPEQNPGDETSEETLLPILKSKLSVLFSSTLWKMFLKGKYEQAAKGYRFWMKPEGLKNGGHSFILGIHEENLCPSFGKEEANQGTPTKCEKKLGILINNLEPVEYSEKIAEKKIDLVMPVRQTKTEHSKALKKTLKNFFVELDSYNEKESIPRWIIVIDGHGKSPRFSAHKDNLKNEKVFSKNGLIANLDIKILGNIIKSLNKKIRLLHLHFHSCYVGRALLKALSLEIPLTDTIITSFSFSGGKEGIYALNSKNEEPYKKFWETMSNFKVKKKLLLDLKNEIFRKKFIEIFTQAVKHLSSRGSPIQDDIKEFSTYDYKNFPVFGSNLPFIKWPKIHNAFFPVPQSQNLVVLQGGKDSYPLSPLCPSVVVCTGKPIGSIRVTKFLKDAQTKNSTEVYPYFVGGSELPFTQTIEELRVPGDLMGFQLLEKVFPEFLYGEGNAKWCIHIKKLVSINEEKSVRAIFGRKTARLLFYKKEEGTYEYYKKSRNSKENEKKITETDLKTAKKKTFNKKWGLRAAILKNYLATDPLKKDG